MTVQTPAGWYPDGTADVVRWWDGNQWTQHTRPHPPKAATPPEPVASDTITDLPIKVTRLGAYKQAQELAAALTAEKRRCAVLANNLAKTGALPLAEIQLQTERAQSELERARAAALAEQSAVVEQRQHLWGEIAKLQTQVIDVRESLVLQEVGLYNFEHPAENSVALAAELAQVRADIRAACAKDGGAWTATTQFVFNNSNAKGNKFVRDLAKMMLSA
ncbi:DUF2510 domain-containing protein [Xylanimonas sp. McL0601]|uniref:DUF2510 domain-containing protein n=1 Tax=Xylanimonas sp. McL0601 TaxID=3414739 RepID=UPI003CF856A1